MEVKVKRSTAPKMELALLKSELVKTQTHLELCRIELGQSTELFKKYLGLSSNENIPAEITFLNPSTSVDSVVSAPENSPTARVLRNLKDQAELNRTLESSDGLPQLKMLGQFGVLGRTNGDFEIRDKPSWAFGLMLSIPLSNGIEGILARKQYEEPVKQSLIKLESSLSEENFSFRTLQKQVSLLSSVIQQLNGPIDELAESVAREKNALKMGEKSAFIWLSSFNRLHDLEIERLSALKKYSASVSQARSLLASPLVF